MGEETATTEHNMDVFVVLWVHQQMLWDPYDPICKTRNKTKDVLLWQIAEDFSRDNLLF